MKKSTVIWIVIGLVFVMSIKRCGSNSNTRDTRTSQSVSYSKTPVDLIVQELSAVQNYSIILYDMDYIENRKTYKHLYTVITEIDDSVQSYTTEWRDVSATFFEANINNLGMEIVSKTDGKLSKAATPAGYSNYVGNPKYGEWRESNGSSFWSFYGRYAFMSSLFRMNSYPVYRSHWNDYDRNYAGRGRSYYGPSSGGRTMYGTGSAYAKSASKSKWNSKSSTFKSSVKNKVSQSSTANKPRSTRTTTSKTTHSSSRYSSSSTRSRGGSYGK